MTWHHAGELAGPPVGRSSTLGWPGMSQQLAGRCLTGTSANSVTVVRGGLAGLVTAITAAEAGAAIRLMEAHARLGGRARSTAGPYVANDGPHVLYADGALWPWLVRRRLARPYRRLPLPTAAGIRFRRGGRLRAAPPPGLLRLLARRNRRAPVDVDFHSWMAATHGDELAAVASAFAGVVTYTADPGRLSAAFVWERLLRVSNPIGGPRYLVGGWGALIGRLEGYARDLGVRIDTGLRVTELPAGPVVGRHLAARSLLERELPSPATSGSTILLDAAVQRRRGDAFLVSDLDDAGWLEAFSRVDKTLCPPGSVLVQAQRPVREGETRAASVRAVEDLMEVGAPGWRDRTLWRRDGAAHHRTGALDLAGHTWHDRPAVDQRDGVFLAGDEVAAPGLLSDVSFSSAVTAADGAVGRLQLRTGHAATT